MKPAIGKVKCIDIKSYKSMWFNQKFIDLMDDDNILTIERLDNRGKGKANGAYVKGAEVSCAIRNYEWDCFEPVTDDPEVINKAPLVDTDNIIIGGHKVITDEEYNRLIGIKKRYNSILDKLKSIEIHKQ